MNTAGTEGAPGPVAIQTRRKLRGDVRYECARHAVEHRSTKLSRHAAAQKRLYRQHILHLWASALVGLLTCRQQAGGGRDHVRYAGSAVCTKRVNAIAPGPIEHHAGEIRKNRRRKDWFGLDRAASAENRGMKFGLSFLFPPTKLLHHGSSYPVDGGKTALINLPRAAHPFGADDERESND